MRPRAAAGWQHALVVVRPALVVAPANFLDDVAAGLSRHGVQAAVQTHDTGAIFDWLQHLVQLQGVSDAVAVDHAERHGLATWARVDAALARRPSCPKLRSHWHFEGCGYRKSTGTCAEPGHFAGCPLPRLPLRKGSLNQAAYSLVLFLRDACDGDLVGWLDARLARADPGAWATNRAAALQNAVLRPLTAVHGIGSKLWSMMLADLLLAGDPERERWVAAGASMIAVDTLVHNHLHRTGVLRRLGAEHRYGSACYGPDRCAAVIDGLAARVDARQFNPAFPACFPRFVQHALWRFCAQDVLNTCNGNRIDDRDRCRNRHCPAYRDCDRVTPGRPQRSLLRPNSSARFMLSGH